MITKEIANELWKDVFGDKEWSQDCFGTWMHRDAWSNIAITMQMPGDTKKYDFSWNVDHLRPKSDFNTESDSDFYNNFEPMHRQNNSEKTDNYPHFTLKDKNYKVFKQSEYYGYGIIDESKNKKIDWKSVQNKHYS